MQLESVIDGNTFITAGQEIRLWGIVAPEKEDPYSVAAKLYLETILKEAPHNCHYVSKDSDHRFLMRCFSQGQDIASMLVRMGVARDFEQHSKGTYKADENYARDNKYGIWKD